MAQQEEVKTNVQIIGGGLAGSEAAYYLLRRGYSVTMFEARPEYKDEAHHTELLGELVCSNSLKSKSLENACGLLKEEMRHMGSLTMESAALSEVPSGNALSVDRDAFAEFNTAKLLSFPNFRLIHKEIAELGDAPTILATGPLTSPDLLMHLSELVGRNSLSFFDASAPIVAKDSIDFSKAYYKSRYEQGDEAYINCPFTREEYFAFVHELTHAEKALVHEFDTQYFEGCLPVEVLASRGVETLRHGPLKPFGLWREGYPRPYAVAQLRQDTKLGDYFNIVGFQTNLTYSEQRRVFSMIPGLEHAEYLRFGLMHRNAYIDSPHALNEDLSLKAKDNVFLAGQLSGVEGYVESAAMGILSAVYLDRKLRGLPFRPVSKLTMLGALVDYVLHYTGNRFEPMNANWALIPGADKKNRLPAVERSLALIDAFMEEKNG
ncbi:MAG: methylenetetrahydrofolate--tRNA-(uracil(54)-C(5))-methyltransferase (FADH(2)-oxidizing) TrmFO [Bacilli bacterium]|nr:methylenetetrahydrofolate--tRNA-(uracil(54)-C(5))-methyltransferase (FADH(2)-oxidizing) TrmFO [Bacilli bacterium]